MRRAWFLVLAVALLLLLPSRAVAATDVAVTITKGKPDQDPVKVQTGDSVHWVSGDGTPYEVDFDQGVIVVPADGSASASVAAGSGFQYAIDHKGSFSVSVSAPKSTSTTAPTTTAPPTTVPTTAAPTTEATTTTSTTSTTTTSTTSTSTTTLPFSSAAPIAAHGDGGGSAAAPLALGALAVAGLAGGSYALWRRSGQPVDGEPPATTEGPVV